MKKAFVLSLFILLAASVPSFAQYQGPGGITPEKSNAISDAIVNFIKENIKDMPRQSPYPGIHVPNQPKQDKQTQKNAPQQKRKDKATPEPKRQEQAKPEQHKSKTTSVKSFSGAARPAGEMIFVKSGAQLSADIKRAIFNQSLSQGS